MAQSLFRRVVKPQRLTVSSNLSGTLVFTNKATNIVFTAVQSASIDTLNKTAHLINGQRIIIQNDSAGPVTFDSTLMVEGADLTVPAGKTITFEYINGQFDVMAGSAQVVGEDGLDILNAPLDENVLAWDDAQSKMKWVDPGTVGGGGGITKVANGDPVPTLVDGTVVLEGNAILAGDTVINGDLVFALSSTTLSGPFALRVRGSVHGINLNKINITPTTPGISASNLLIGGAVYRTWLIANGLGSGNGGDITVGGFAGENEFIQASGGSDTGSGAGVGGTVTCFGNCAARTINIIGGGAFDGTANNGGLLVCEGHLTADYVNVTGGGDGGLGTSGDGGIIKVYGGTTIRESMTVQGGESTGGDGKAGTVELYGGGQIKSLNVSDGALGGGYGVQTDCYFAGNFNIGELVTSFNPGADAVRIFSKFGYDTIFAIGAWITPNSTPLSLWHGVPGSASAVVNNVAAETYRSPGGQAWIAAAPGLSDPMTTRGDVLVRNASNVTDRLPVGGANQVLTSDGTDVSWQSPTGGAGGGPLVITSNTTISGTIDSDVVIATNNVYYDANLTIRGSVYFVNDYCALAASKENLLLTIYGDVYNCASDPENIYCQIRNQDNQHSSMADRIIIHGTAYGYFRITAGPVSSSYGGHITIGAVQGKKTVIQSSAAAATNIRYPSGNITILGDCIASSLNASGHTLSNDGLLAGGDAGNIAIHGNAVVDAISLAGGTGKIFSWDAPYSGADGGDGGSLTVAGNCVCTGNISLNGGNGVGTGAPPATGGAPPGISGNGGNLDIGGMVKADYCNVNGGANNDEGTKGQSGNATLRGGSQLTGLSMWGIASGAIARLSGDHDIETIDNRFGDVTIRGGIESGTTLRVSSWAGTAVLYDGFGNNPTGTLPLAAGSFASQSYSCRRFGVWYYQVATGNA